MNLNSEFICQTVSVVSTEPHPNADRLELITISLDGNTPHLQKLVNAKGLIPGQIVGYVGPDALVPLESEYFSFLKSRLDAKDKLFYRLKSARLRGIYSPGILVDNIPNNLNVNTDLSTLLNVKPYDTDEHLTTGKGFNGPLKRKLKDLYPVYSVTSLRKSPNYFTKGEQVIVTEKIHGTNFRFGYGGKRKFYYGTHKTNLSDNRNVFIVLWQWLLRKSKINKNPGFGNPWAEAVNYFNLKKVCKKAKQYIFYGELFGKTANGKEIQKGFSYGYNRLNLQIFDIYDSKTKTWLTYNDRCKVLYSILFDSGLFSVITIASGEFSMENIKQQAELDSVYGGIREGVVIESLSDPTRKAKWVSERYHLSKD